jgi:hypothetical protein
MDADGFGVVGRSMLRAYKVNLVLPEIYSTIIRTNFRFPSRSS